MIACHVQIRSAVGSEFPTLKAAKERVSVIDKTMASAIYRETQEMHVKANRIILEVERFHSA
jgi:hypothetical protein